MSGPFGRCGLVAGASQWRTRTGHPPPKQPLRRALLAEERLLLLDQPEQRGAVVMISLPFPVRTSMQAAPRTQFSWWLLLSPRRLPGA